MKKSLSLLFTIALTALTSAALAAPEQPGQFETLLKKLSQPSSSVSEEEVIEFLKLAHASGHPVQAAPIVKNYLTQNRNPSPALILLAAENAWLCSDDHTAVSRYKSYLRAAEPNVESSDAAARLYAILIDFVKDKEDAWQFMRENGDKFRQSPAARRFDTWFVAEARTRKDYGALLRRFNSILADKLPADEERLYFGDSFDAMLSDFSRGAPDQFDSLPALKSLAPLVRDQARTLSINFVAAHLAYCAGRRGKPDDILAQDFEPVIGAATAQFNATPTAATLQFILRTFAGGPDVFNEQEWREQVKAKQDFFVAAFAKLNDADRVIMMTWKPSGVVAPRLLATRDQWALLGAKYPQLFSVTDNVRDIQFVTAVKDLAQAQAEATFLKSVTTRTAAVINSLAASSDLSKAGSYLLNNQSWFLPLGDVYDIWDKDLSPAGTALYKLTPEAAQSAQLDFGNEALTKTPLALFDRKLARSILLQMWYATPDKLKMLDTVKGLAWVPANEHDRKDIFSGLAGEFKNWQNSLKSQKSDPKAQALLAASAALGEAIGEAMTNAGNTALAPNPLCQKLAELEQARFAHNSANYLRAAQEAYEIIKDYDVKKTPFGVGALAIILRSPEGIPVADFQAQVISNQLATADAQSAGPRLRVVMDCIRTAHGWDEWVNSPVANKAEVLQFNAVLANALSTMIDHGQFDPVVFNFFRSTRQNNHWSSPETGQDLFVKLIDKHTFVTAGYRPRSDIRSAAVGYLWLIRNEFPKLAEKYTPDASLDDIFVDEATRTGYLDANYLQYTHDTKHKVANIAAKILAKMDGLPLGDDDGKSLYRKADLWALTDLALTAEQPLREALVARIEASAGKTRFDEYAFGNAYFDSVVNPTRQDFFGKLANYVKQIKTVPTRLPAPSLAALPHVGRAAQYTSEEMAPLVDLVLNAAPPEWPRGYDEIANNMTESLLSRNATNELFAIIPALVRIAKDGPAGVRRLQTLGESAFRAKQFDLAAAISGALLEFGGVLPEDTRASMQTIRTQSLTTIGGGNPVDSHDPRFPIFAAQADYNIGNLTGAWTQFLPHADRATDMVKELDPKFVIWLIEKAAETHNFEVADAIAHTFLPWMDSPASGADPELRGTALIAYADIAFQQEEYPKARALYERVNSAAEFEPTLAKPLAELKIANVNRLTKQYDKALETLDKLSRRKERDIQTETYYQLAQIDYDREQYPEARKHLDEVFLRQPDHADARILAGNIDLKTKHLDEAKELQVGLSSAQRILVPGQPLRVHLEDQNLATVGKSASIEIHVWTSSGDDEYFNLVPFGDSKTKFEGSLNTAMGPVVKGDHVLQVFGNDTISYDFSEKFKKEHNIVDEPITLTVASDSELYISSGRILTQSELEERQLEEMLQRRLNLTNHTERTSLSLVRPSNQIKPGNKINVRVIDFDRNITPGPDKIKVDAASTSGGQVRGLELTETGPTTGIFEGAIPTASAPAKAYATDSMEGRLPDFPISAGNHGAWQADANNQRPKLYSVDLKDNVVLGKLHLLADVPDRKLKRFAVQTSLNGRTFQTLATYPETFVPWDGSLKLEIMKYSSQITPRVPADLVNWLQTGGPEQGNKARSVPVSGLLVQLDQSLAGLADQMHIGPADSYIVHLQGAFEMPAHATRTFRLDTKETGGAQYALAIDGEFLDRTIGYGRSIPALTDQPAQVKRSLSKGVHRIDIYAISNRARPPRFDLQWDTDKPPYMITCPIDSFDPKKDPAIAKEMATMAAKIEPSTNGTAFDISFPPDSHARVLRFILDDFGSDAPAISQVTLTDADGKTVLPTQQDLTTLNQNQILEIVPGDVISVTYKAPKVVTPGTQIHEANMQATYANGTINATFIEYTGEGASRVARYIPLRRFQVGDAINVMINDPDEDVSDAPDKVTFTAKTAGGKPITVEALETDDHSGIFMGRIFPVKGEPQRATELQVGESDDVTLSYLDKENTDPGVPWYRTTVLEQANWVTPQLRVYNVISLPAAKTITKTQINGADIETYTDNRLIVSTRPADPATNPAMVATNLIDAPLQVEVLWPTIALSPESTTPIYVQTTSALKKAGKQLPPSDFDPTVPGTVKLTAIPSGIGQFPVPPGYQSVTIRGDSTATDPLSDGRFSYTIPLKLGDVADQPVSDDANAGTPSVYVNGADDLYVGYQYKDKDGASKWLTQRVVLTGDAFLDVMDRKYQEPLSSMHVGETVYFRVLDKTKHINDGKDVVALNLVASSGATGTVKAVEAVGDSGEFKGYATFNYFQDRENTNQANSLAVNYGDTVKVSYQAHPGGAFLTREIQVYKGADGVVTPFTKRFKDSEVAVQTQFTIAEAYFELAKKHRELNEETLCRREIAQGKKILEEALRDYPDTKLKAQADYLLANLSLEFATMATDPDAKQRNYTEAIARFSDLVATYPDSPYAPKSQFKKALTFERMGEIDKACEEYVKLSYRYPDNELVADTIVRLGQYFFTKGTSLVAQAEIQTDKIAAEKLKIEARARFTTAAEVFSRLSVRFPSHPLASRSLLLSGQCYMRAENYEKTIKTFHIITDDVNADKDVRSEAMYWCGDANMKLKDPDHLVEAYRMFKKLTWDYPESKWAKYARGRLTEDALAAIETKDTDKGQ